MSVTIKVWVLLSELGVFLGVYGSADAWQEAYKEFEKVLGDGKIVIREETL